MSSVGVLAGGFGRGGACSVQEEDWQRGQSYSATWHSLSLVPQPQHRATVLEVEHSRKQSLSRQWEARRLLQRCLSGAVTQGPLLAGAHSARSPAQPTSTSSALGARVQRGPTIPPILEEVWCVSVPKRAVVVGAGAGRELPQVRTTVVGMSKMPRSLVQAMSQEAHRG